MDKFNPEDLKIQGKQFLLLTLNFSPDTGLKRVDKFLNVDTNNGLSPCNGCDFIAGGHSRASRAFYEKSGQPEFQTLFIKRGTFSSYCYIWAENINELEPLFIQGFIDQLKEASTRHFTQAKALYDLVSKLEKSHV